MSKKEIAVYMKSDIIQQNFADVLDSERGGKAFVASVLAAVGSNSRLQNCTNESIYVSAIRSAALGLSVDPALGHAYLVPFGDKCTFIPGYKGLHQLALRTGRYRYINVSPIYEGQTVELNPLNGFYVIDLSKKKSNEVVGWFGSFELDDRFMEHVYMTIEEIHAHGKKYSKSYGDKSSPWQTETAKMERKTVMIQLLALGPLNPNDRAALNTTNGDVFEVPDVEILDVEDVPRLTAEEEIESLGFPKEEGAQENVARFTEAQINKVVNAKIMPDKPSTIQALELSVLPTGVDDKTLSLWCQTFAGYFYSQSMSVEQSAAQANDAYRKMEKK